jgi:triosephosphate isomerase
MKKLIAGNWKLNGSFDMTNEFDQAMADCADHIEWLICPPAPYIVNIESTARGAQDCSTNDNGAYTGEISAAMLSDIGCDYCIVGHSERRANHSETNEMVREKAEQLLVNNITAIICVGETLDQREAGQANVVVTDQIKHSMPAMATADNVVIAYEPVWAIGTGKAATVDDVTTMHAMIRDLLKSTLDTGAEMRILYGGSVKPSNASELLNLDNVDGALIGGASLKIEDFTAIGNAVNS